MKGPGFVPTFLFYFVGTTFIAAFVLNKGVGPDLTFNPFQVGILFGLASGVVGAYFNSHQTLTLPIKNRGAFLKKLKDTLKQLGYEESGQLEEFTVYSRPIPSSFFAGKLYVQIEKETATISGRGNKIRLIQKRLNP
ncbi:hypothetical protein J5X98_00545 [Leptothermofonsia sichuanensis E412]|uniref:hypothetical protein n=1 Tax=Leptothermofonsia sichuanensis TaxID=2917832 RepID=UPI001CA6D15E|nr:hypothetical protein [Leptothermofonsia sichuanensis]QZZ21039.1 hypothetical protein J5X98_00545 [Leptothermofonsia sichuanensis E412]